ncbi:amino acid permease/ SLC12A domain-containing protein [Xylaria bambusicola]|uniref:amino acid permease/ SLC12A domain-containing protein n=1 Tax=Xylaria bambusicola TaxID=326684 RepID=UPI002007F0E6|nr:amino acid permease/ SLC12A domain-containing protein [Xylaria bambusicola]KAI0506010.1 amino acid permease/ SLC12A domain-containing protein [Xylaria bambusicola]
MATTPGNVATTPGSPELASTGLEKVITTRQFIFMALGSSIGAGLLIASGQALDVSGPAPLLIAFAMNGFAVWVTMCNLGELSTHFPGEGSFYEFSVRFISPAWGFTMGWNYVLNMIFIVPFEIIIVVMCARYWDINISALYLVPVIIFGLIVIYAFGTRWYAEAENLFGILKIIVIAVFIVTAICILAGGVRTDPRPTVDLAYKQWGSGAFLNGAPGFFFAFATAGMAYGGTEMLGLTAAECCSPQRVMKLAMIAVRIILLHLVPVLLLSLVLTSRTSPSANNDGSAKELISPFVVAVSEAHIPVLPDFMNVVIVTSIFSVASACVFAASRALQAISARGMGPRFCGRLYRDKPVGALAIIFAFSLLSFIKAAKNGDEVFVWLLSLNSCSNYLTWLSICVAQIRCRLALKRQRRSFQDPQAYNSPVGIIGSVVAVIIFAYGLVVQIAAGAKSPLVPPPPVAASFIGLVVVVVLWVGYMLYMHDRTFMIPLDMIEFGHKENIFIPTTLPESDQAPAV